MEMTDAKVVEKKIYEEGKSMTIMLLRLQVMLVLPLVSSAQHSVLVLGCLAVTTAVCLVHSVAAICLRT